MISSGVSQNELGIVVANDSAARKVRDWSVFFRNFFQNSVMKKTKNFSLELHRRSNHLPAASDFSTSFRASHNFPPWFKR
jgi:hypothetical protein